MVTHALACGACRVVTALSTPAKPLPPVPALDMSKVKGCSGCGAVPKPLTQEQVVAGADDAALCFEASANRAVHKDALLVDNRCYIFRAATGQVGST